MINRDQYFRVLLLHTEYEGVFPAIVQASALQTRGVNVPQARGPLGLVFWAEQLNSNSETEPCM